MRYHKNSLALGQSFAERDAVAGCITGLYHRASEEVVFPIISYLFHFLSLGAKVMIISISSKLLGHFPLAEYLHKTFAESNSR